MGEFPEILFTQRLILTQCFSSPVVICADCPRDRWSAVVTSYDDLHERLSSGFRLVRMG